jgi:hypothetical protein
MIKEFDLLVKHALTLGRIEPAHVAGLRQWFDSAHHLMASYRPEGDQPQAFEGQLLAGALSELHRLVTPQRFSAREGSSAAESQ